jgi:hypothetical protein
MKSGEGMNEMVKAKENRLWQRKKEQRNYFSQR